MSLGTSRRESLELRGSTGSRTDNRNRQQQNNAPEEEGVPLTEIKCKGESWECCRQTDPQQKFTERLHAALLADKHLLHSFSQEGRVKNGRSDEAGKQIQEGKMQDRENRREWEPDASLLQTFKLLSLLAGPEFLLFLFDVKGVWFNLVQTGAPVLLLKGNLFLNLQQLLDV
ncbi:hypothetical protein EYF80_047895 [Liparis tanakae]|uniref:Uncharacterized protein n=1 Tax=Liparis tanakae TaxID=230148 RepID=A0A4Z2FL13_9TELE|nr:hypothetical protein EYF80_047895 [Liparis tanakae]